MLVYLTYYLYIYLVSQLKSSKSSGSVGSDPKYLIPLMNKTKLLNPPTNETKYPPMKKKIEYLILMLVMYKKNIYHINI